MFRRYVTIKRFMVLGSSHLTSFRGHGNIVDGRKLKMTYG